MATWHLSAHLDQIVVDREHGELQASDDAGLVEDPREVVLDGDLGDRKTRRDLPVRLAACHRAGDLELAAGETEWLLFE